MESYINLRYIIRKRNLLAHISIWTIVALTLAISLTIFKGSLFGIIYLTFALTFTLSFQSFYATWARSIKSFCVALIICSSIISLLTYSYQYSSVNSWFQEILSEQLLNDIGLKIRTQTWMLFFEPLVPLVLTLFLLLYINIFHHDFGRFAYLAEEDDTSLSTPLTGSQLIPMPTTINDSTIITLSNKSILDQGSSGDQVTQASGIDKDQQDASRRGSLSNQPQNSSSIRLDPQSSSKRDGVEQFLKAVVEVFWRILETHFIKLVAFMMFRLPIIDLCLMNSPFLIIVIFALKHPSLSRCCCLTASWLISFIIITRQLFNLTTLRPLDIIHTCGPDAPAPIVGNHSYLAYFGISHNDNEPMSSVNNHIVIMILTTIYSFVCIHHEKRGSKDFELSFGMIFSGVGRRQADNGVVDTFKYLCNFGFYKFGVEITCLVLAIAISNRLDLIAAVYGIILMILSIKTSKKSLGRIWPVLNLLVCLLIPIQYMLRLGLPRGLCMPYPWEFISNDFKYWLYLSDYEEPQNEKLLLYDFLVMLAMCRQSNVFKQMTINSSPQQVTNNRVYHDFSANQFRSKYLPSEDEYVPDDCFSDYTTPSNYLKLIFFVSIYWITLAVVLVSGATKVSLFSFGYLIGCFIFLWLGNDAYLMPLPRLIFSWNWFIAYAALVIFTKVILQFFACQWHEVLLQNYCYILRLLRVVCYRKLHDTTESTTDKCTMTLPNDELDILWDGLCLVFLLMQRVVFGSQYFKYLVQEVRAQQILASRGAELIMATQIEEVKAQNLYEKEVMRSIRAKMEDLKMDDDHTSKAWKRLLTLPHHHQIIRNANKHLFSSSDDEPVAQYRTDDWKFKKAFIPDPLGDELERMGEINGISAVFTRWMKGKPLYGGSSLNSPAYNNQDNIDNVVQDGEVDGRNDTRIGVTGEDQQQATTSGGVALVGSAFELQDLSGPRNVGLRRRTAGWTPVESYDVIHDEEAKEDSDRIRGWWDMLNLIVYSCLLSVTVELNKLSRSYRYVSRRMANEKNALKKHFKLNDERFKNDPNWRKWVISTLSETYEEYQGGNHSNTSLHRIRSALKAITSINGGSNSSQDSAQSVDGDRSPQNGALDQPRQQNRAELTDPEYYFLKLNIFTQFCRALAYVFISNTSLLCQLVIILNQVLTESSTLISLPLPLMTFLWGTLSLPRPTKRFWQVVITWTELVIVLEYIFPFYDSNLLGTKNITIVYDLILLLVLFFHRSKLKSLGQWDASAAIGSEPMLDHTNITPQSPRKKSAAIVSNQQDEIAIQTGPDDMRLVKSYDLQENIHRSIEQESRVSSSVDLNLMRRTTNGFENSYQNGDHRVDVMESPSVEFDGSKTAGKSCCCGCLAKSYYRVKRSITVFFQQVLNTSYKVQTDVYVWMFLCDFINFLILIYGFWAFGSGYTNQTVANFLNENRIPFSVLIMLLAQFGSIIVDRAFYLQKNLTGKLTFQVILVIAIHFWLFFALPFTTGHELTWPPKAWYVFKCIYFLLSAHQIRCGYPRRVLGNCFTKSYGYANWGAFKVYRAIPLVYDLRLYMDWIWTETTLEFRNWSLMEDMFANLFIRKCELTLEEEYPQPRARPIRHLSKYLTGGAFILLILAIIWGPLLLFSMGKTVGESNPPVEMEFELEFVGFQPILRMRATTQQITILDNNQYDALKNKFKSLSSQSFLGDYKAGDVVAIKLDGQSNAVWEISPPSKQLLMNRIKNNDTLTLKSTWTFFRIKTGKSQNFDASIAGSSQYEIKHSENSTEMVKFREELFEMLANSSTTQTPDNEIKFVETPEIFPNYLRVPETGQVSLVDQFNENNKKLRPLRLSYIRMYEQEDQTSTTSWWKAEDLCKHHTNNDTYSFWGPEVFEHCNSLVIVAFNDRIFTGILALLSAPGIIGLYTTFVVFFARLIRTEPSGKVIYTEIPNVDRVYGLIMDIYMMRECGEFELEEKLFAKLLFLYRSPEMLIEFSKREDEVHTGSDSP